MWILNTQLSSHQHSCAQNFEKARGFVLEIMCMPVWNHLQQLHAHVLENTHGVSPSLILSKTRANDEKKNIRTKSRFLLSFTGVLISS